MSRRAVVLGVLAAGVGLVVVGVRSLGSTDDEAIREQLDRLARAASVDSEEPMLARTGRVRGEFSKIFAKDVRYDIPELQGVATGRGSLGDLAVQAGMMYRPANVSFGSPSIEITPVTSDARVIADATVSGLRGGQPEKDERHVTVHLSKIDGGWLIDSIKVDRRASPP